MDNDIEDSKKESSNVARGESYGKDGRVTMSDLSTFYDGCIPIIEQTKNDRGYRRSEGIVGRRRFVGSRQPWC